MNEQCNNAATMRGCDTVMQVDDVGVGVGVVLSVSRLGPGAFGCRKQTCSLAGVS